MTRIGSTAFAGLTVNFKCGECGTDFAVDVPGTEPEHLPATGTLKKTVN